MLQLPANKLCADCHARNPRYTSLTFGVFICNRCFGVHRGLGTHISRTRSVTLDTWNDEQIRAMTSVGNDKAVSLTEQPRDMCLKLMRDVPH
ncbi:hypothetical protein GUITHDRAFT_77435 [Guillardia theta CCMP2712]|uniref:Arf-GAP domain-containing protein n=1 Tax=Guillardia theta (strain CCMP2712) TaxID=905079 RepID=L1IPE0_GUITC|nr:hypothetical protein GUITHDRAFT_77435 [Guillardia theta CCMP2712]EKX38156.1 hypothetical protein GUITHDRAFT_77435 [Guillardia theta CCMP2712]|eukprot:XP_005825136.1 hypothetical protein GUITHDRAFT_77435 [Guillardia theta CCMP2712]